MRPSRRERLRQRLRRLPGTGQPGSGVPDHHHYDGDDFLQMIMVYNDDDDECDDTDHDHEHCND